MLISIFIGAIIGYFYGLFFWKEKRRALSFSYNSKHLNRNLSFRFSSRIFLLITFFLILLLLKSFNPILVLISMLTTFWIVILNKERVFHE